MEPFEAFIQPKKIRLPLKFGEAEHFIDVKDRLTAGELEDLHAIWQPLINPGTGVQMQTRQVRFAKVQAYLLGWSFTSPGDNGDRAPVDVSAGAIESLAPEVFSAIHRAIEQHEWKRDAEVAELKKTTAGEPASSETLPSVAR